MSTVRWQGPHGWRFGTLVRQDKNYAYIKRGDNPRLNRVPLDQIKAWPGEKKKK